MINLSKIISYLAPFLITICVFLYLYSKEKQKKPTEIPKKIETVKETDSINEIEFADWKNKVTKKLSDGYYDNLLIKNQEITYRFKNLNDNRQQLLEIIILTKVKNDCRNISNKASEIQKMELDHIEKLCTEKININFKKMYNSDDNLHPADKNFLDNLNVYILKSR